MILKKNQLIANYRDQIPTLMRDIEDRDDMITDLNKQLEKTLQEIINLKKHLKIQIN